MADSLLATWTSQSVTVQLFWVSSKQIFLKNQLFSWDISLCVTRVTLFANIFIFFSKFQIEFHSFVQRNMCVLLPFISQCSFFKCTKYLPGEPQKSCSKHGFRGIFNPGFSPLQQRRKKNIACVHEAYNILTVFVWMHLECIQPFLHICL